MIHTCIPSNIQKIVAQYDELDAVTVAGACNLWTAGLSEVGTRAKRLRITRSATTAPNGAALISAQFRVPRRIRGTWRRTLFYNTSHREMCFRIMFSKDVSEKRLLDIHKHELGIFPLKKEICLSFGNMPQSHLRQFRSEARHRSETYSRCWYGEETAVIWPWYDIFALSDMKLMPLIWKS